MSFEQQDVLDIIRLYDELKRAKLEKPVESEKSVTTELPTTVSESTCKQEFSCLQEFICKPESTDTKINTNLQCLIDILKQSNETLKSIEKGTQKIIELTETLQNRYLADGIFDNSPFDEVFIDTAVKDAIDSFSASKPRVAMPISVQTPVSISLTPLPNTVINALSDQEKNRVAVNHSVLPQYSSPICQTGCTGQIGYTGVSGSQAQNNSPSTKPDPDAEFKYIIPSHLRTLIGDWRGLIDNKLVKVRFETTNRSHVFAYVTVCTPPTPPFGQYADMTCNTNEEALASKVRFNNTKGTIFIEDTPMGAMSCWFNDDTIIGSLASGTSVHLVKTNRWD